MTRTCRQFRVALLSAILMAPLAGCGGKKGEEPTSSEAARVQETGQELSKNPLAAIAQMGQAAQDAAAKSQAAAARKPVEPVRFDVLLPFLPGAVEGFTADEAAQGNTTSMGEFKITVVQASFSRQEGETGSNVRIEITDGGFVPMVYMPFHMMSQFASEGTDGYKKGVTVDGHPGFESWEKDSNTTEIWTLVADRFLVHVYGGNVAPDAVRALVTGLRLGELAKLE